MTGARHSPLHPALRRRGEGIAADGEFYMPTRVLFGRGIAAAAGTHAASLGARTVMLVTDPGVAAAGLRAGALWVCRAGSEPVKLQPGDRALRAIDAALTEDHGPGPAQEGGTRDDLGYRDYCR